MNKPESNLIRKAFARMGDGDFVLLLTALVIVGSVWSFLAIGNAIQDDEIPSFDKRVMASLRHPDNPKKPIGPAWLIPATRDVTALGSFVVLCFVTLMVSGYLLLAKKYHALILVVVVIVGGSFLSDFLKRAYNRPRPNPEFHLDQVTTPSFPSGHTMGSAVVYLTLGVLLSRLVEQLRFKVYFVSLAVLLTVLVGLSRIYLGVHYPTDVLGGWTAGLAWSLAWWLLVRYLQQTQAVEKP